MTWFIHLLGNFCCRWRLILVKISQTKHPFDSTVSRVSSFHRVFKLDEAQNTRLLHCHQPASRRKPPQAAASPRKPAFQLFSICTRWVSDGSDGEGVISIGSRKKSAALPGAQSDRCTYGANIFVLLTKLEACAWVPVSFNVHWTLKWICFHRSERGLHSRVCKRILGWVSHEDLACSCFAPRKPFKAGADLHKQISDW